MHGSRSVVLDPQTYRELSKSTDRKCIMMIPMPAPFGQGHERRCACTKLGAGALGSFRDRTLANRERSEEARPRQLYGRSGSSSGR